MTRYAGGKILIVDDDTALANRIVRILEREGYETLCSHSADEAEALTQSAHPDLVITDFHMPGRSGLSLLAGIRAYAPTQDVPVILLTGESWERIGNESHSRGIDVFLKKPLDVDTLLRVVERQLDRAQRAASQLNSFRERVAATIPHELRTPLTGVIGLGSLLADHADALAGDPEQIATFGRAVLASGERLQRLVESYLLYVQLETSQIRPSSTSPRHTDVSGSITTTAKSTAARHKREADVHLRRRGECFMVEEDEEPIFEKITEELVDNACKFSPAGTPIEITISMGADGHSEAITVRDQGRGMSPAQIDQIAPFVQFDRERHEQQGSGLGLSLAKRLAEAVDAKLSIAAPNEGGLAVTVTRTRSNRAG
ncbi:MAG: response regulator [Spirochaetales bacterium]